MLGRLKDLSMNMDGTQDLRITFDADLSEMFYDLEGCEVDVEIKKHYKKRSLDANAMCWYIIDQIAEKTKERKSDIYRHAIREIGGVSDIVCAVEEAVDTLTRGWTSHGLGWQVDVGPSKTPGCKNVTLYYGSSMFNTKQMSDLIDSVIQEAEQQGIPTPSQKRRDELIAQWGRKKKEGDADGKVDTAG